MSVLYGDIKCQALCKSGKNKGNQCKNKAKFKYENKYYCGVHCKNTNKKCLPKNINGILKYNYIKKEDLIFIQFLCFKIFNILKDILFDIINIEIVYKDICLFALCHNWYESNYIRIEFNKHVHFKYLLGIDYTNNNAKLTRKIGNYNIEYKNLDIKYYNLNKILKYYYKFRIDISFSTKKCIFDKYIKENQIEYTKNIDNTFFKYSHTNLDIILLSHICKNKF